MKKYIPLSVILFLLGGFALHHFVLTGFDATKANIGDKVKDKKTYYENLYPKMKFTEFEGKKQVFDFKKIKAPVVVLNFWASWCTPCLEEFPDIVKMKKQFTGEQVLVLAINGEDENQERNIRMMVKKHKLNFPIIKDANGNISEKFLISAIPVSIIFHKGKVIEIVDGVKDFASAETIELFKGLIKKN